MKKEREKKGRINSHWIFSMILCQAVKGSFLIRQKKVFAKSKNKITFPSIKVLRTLHDEDMDKV